MKNNKSKYNSALFQHLVLEMTSWYGRNFKNRNNKIVKGSNKQILLDLGVGLNYKEGWVNIDFYRIPKVKFWKKYKERPKIDLELDLRYPLPFSDNVVDGVYSGHTLEHLELEDALSLLGEVYRVLKPGCWLRINVPDLGKYIDFYNGKVTSQEFKQFSSGCEAIHALTQNWGHRSCWDTEFLGKTLSKIGYINIKKVEFGIEAFDKRLIKEEKVREWETLVMEAQKPKN